MLGLEVLTSKRLTTGGHTYVYGIKTGSSEYVIRIADMQYRDTFAAAVYWQNKLLPLSIPLAKFIGIDLDGKYSSFAALLMHRLPGDDLCNVYKDLSSIDKQNLAAEIVKIQTAMQALPEGSGYGFANSYESTPQYKSWYDFIIARLMICKEALAKSTSFDQNVIPTVLAATKELETDLRLIKALPFMWDTSERNVMVFNGKISGIVDVDDLCFGDPLFVLGLTYVALEQDGQDTIYMDSWAKLLRLDKQAQRRLQFYRLFYVTWFMRSYSNKFSPNGQAYNLDARVLKTMFQQALIRMQEHKL